MPVVDRTGITVTAAYRRLSIPSALDIRPTKAVKGVPLTGDGHWRGRSSTDTLAIQRRGHAKDKERFTKRYHH